MAGAHITIRNPETASAYDTITTETGNYLAAQLPAAVYEMTVASPGFSTYIQKGIRVEVAQTARVDVSLAVGSTQESVTVTADASLLKTDSADVSTNLSTDRIDKLPLYGARAGDAGIRSPFAGLRLVPGATLELSGSGNNNVRVNGMPNNTYQVRVEGQEATDSFSPQYPTGIQPGVDALEEVSFQTSNYAAEYGQVGGGLINFTSKSGTNNFHGNLFEYLNNEALNAGNPFTMTETAIWCGPSHASMIMAAASEALCGFLMFTTDTIRRFSFSTSSEARALPVPAVRLKQCPRSLFAMGISVQF